MRQISRRVFLAGSASFALTTAGGISVRADESVPIRYTADGFSPFQERRLAEAMTIVRARFCSLLVLQNVYRLRDAWRPSFHDDYWIMANVAGHMAREFLMYFQLNSLRRLNNGFPAVHFFGLKFEEAFLAKARLGTVVVRRAGDSPMVRGSFVVKMNLKTFDCVFGSNTEKLAGVIVHEMLHNLGHKHGGSNGGNSTKWQMVAFEECFKANGAYNISE